VFVFVVGLVDNCHHLWFHRVGFDNATYLSEVQHADRNFALSYFMKVLVRFLVKLSF
jgi:glutaminase